MNKENTDFQLRSNQNEPKGIEYFISAISFFIICSVFWGVIFLISQIKNTNTRIGGFTLIIGIYLFIDHRIAKKKLNDSQEGPTTR
jgi:hypothetical protein